jgi:hypothetical protein
MPDADPRPPSMRQPEGARSYARAVDELNDRDLAFGDDVTVLLINVAAPLVSVSGRVATATESVLVLDEGKNRHRVPWDSIARITTTTEPEHPGL